MSDPSPLQNALEFTCTKPSGGGGLPQADKEAMQIPRLQDAQPVVQVEIFRPAGMFWPGEGDDKTFFIHRDFLRHHSYLFRLQYDARLKYMKVPKLSISFPGFSALGRFIEWAYTGKIDTTDWSQQDVLFLWIFAEKIGAPHLQNYTISHLHQLRKREKMEPLGAEMLFFVNHQEAADPLKRYVKDTSDGKISGLWQEKGTSPSSRNNIDIGNYFVNVEEVARQFLKPPSNRDWMPDPPADYSRGFDGPGGSWSS